MGGAPSRVGVSEHTSTGRAVGVPGATEGFQYASRECRCASANMKSEENRNMVDSYLETKNSPLKMKDLEFLFLWCLALSGLNISSRALLDAVAKCLCNIFSHTGCLTPEIFLRLALWERSGQP